jgi:hypothetical protein
MCAAYGLIETHMGLKDSEAAKAQAAERFIALHFKLLSYQEMQPEGIAGHLNSAQSDPSVSFLCYVFININSRLAGMLTPHPVCECVPSQHTSRDDTLRTYIASS